MEQIFYLDCFRMIIRLIIQSVENFNEQYRSSIHFPISHYANLDLC